MRQPSPSSGSLDANTPKAGGSSTFSTPALSPSPFSSPSPSPAFVNTVNKDEHDHSHRLNASLRAGDGPDEHGHRQSEGQASGASPTRQDGHEDVEDPSTYPSNRLWLVMAGIMGQVFLSALDQSIVSTATPTIVADLQSSPTQGSNLYSWIGTSYLLTSSATIPLYASVSDVIGRRPCLWIAGALFLGGSALCGAAQSLSECGESCRMRSVWRLKEVHGVQQSS